MVSCLWTCIASIFLSLYLALQLKKYWFVAYPLFHMPEFFLSPHCSPFLVFWLCVHLRWPISHHGLGSLNWWGCLTGQWKNWIKVVPKSLCLSFSEYFMKLHFNFMVLFQPARNFLYIVKTMYHFRLELPNTVGLK